MIRNQGKEYYPLDFGRAERNGRVYYDRSARGKSWFYLDLRGTAAVWQRFVPAGAESLVTADGKQFCVQA